MLDPKQSLKKNISASILIVFALCFISSVIFTVSGYAQDSAEAAQQPLSQEQASVNKYAFIAAAAAFGLGAIGAGIAIANVGAAAMGAVAEKPEIAGQALIFVALAEGLVVFGFITALMILGKIQ
ncbi:ATPase [candidate division KSB1 bacterium]|nr:ATPase [candidate division KSB1 bacterium]